MNLSRVFIIPCSLFTTVLFGLSSHFFIHKCQKEYCKASKQMGEKHGRDKYIYIFMKLLKNLKCWCFLTDASEATYQMHHVLSGSIFLLQNIFIEQGKNIYFETIEKKNSYVTVF